MPIAEGGRRLPCVVCGARLYFHERAQDLCRACAELAGISRICDAPGQLERVIAQDATELFAEPMILSVPPRHAMSLHAATYGEAWLASRAEHHSECAVRNGGVCTCGGC